MSLDRILQQLRRRILLHSLLLGLALIIIGGCGSAPPSATPTATAPTDNAGVQAALTARRTQVLHQRQGQNPEQVQVESPRTLNKGDGINVDQDGRASLRFFDALQVEIFHDTALTIKGEIDPGASALEIFALEGGTTLSQVDLDAIAQKRVRLTTKWAVIDDLGTEFISYYDPQSETTWIVVRKGLVEVRAPNANVPPAAQVVRVNAGEQTWVEPQQPPVAPVPAVRSAVGNRFPPLEDLTDGELSDAAWLPALDSFNADRTTLLSGATTQATITLSGPAYEGGVLVTLTNSAPAALAAPASVLIPADALSQTFTLTATTVTRPTDVELIAAYGDVQRPIRLTIQTPSTPPSPAAAPALATLALSPATIDGGGVAYGIVTLSAPAPQNGVEISLISSDETLAPVPPLAVVPAGATSQRFPIRTSLVAQDTEVTITASDINGPPQRQTLTILAAPALADFTIEPSSVIGGDSARGQIVLTRAAPPGGVAVALKSSRQDVALPDNVTVGEGKERAAFEIVTRPVKAPAEAVISASLGGASIQQLLTVTPQPQPDLTVEQDNFDVTCTGQQGCFLLVNFTVSNLGNAAVGQRFLVSIEADELEPQTLVVDSLPAGESVELQARLGPGGNCYNPDCTITITVDPSDAIRESSEDNNRDSSTSLG
jgi:hypothetical protein